MFSPSEELDNRPCNFFCLPASDRYLLSVSQNHEAIFNQHHKAQINQKRTLTPEKALIQRVFHLPEGDFHTVDLTLRVDFHKLLPCLDILYPVKRNQVRLSVKSHLQTSFRFFQPGRRLTHRTVFLRTLVLADNAGRQPRTPGPYNRENR